MNTEQMPDFEDRPLEDALREAMLGTDAGRPEGFLGEVRRRRRVRIAQRVVFSGSGLGAVLALVVWIAGTPQNSERGPGVTPGAVSLLDVGAHSSDRISPASPGGRVRGAVPRAGMGPEAAAAASLIEL